MANITRNKRNEEMIKILIILSIIVQIMTLCAILQLRQTIIDARWPDRVVKIVHNNDYKYDVALYDGTINLDGIEKQDNQSLNDVKGLK